MTVKDQADRNFVKNFEENGYAIIRGILNPAQVHELRAIYDEKITDLVDELVASDILSDSRIANVIFSESTTSIIKKLLGDNYIVYPNMVGRKNRFPGWHVDSAYHEDFVDGGDKYLTTHAFRHCQCVIYLQDSTENGGGIDVVPGTQYESLKYNGSTIAREEIDRLAHNKIRVETKAGDLLLFDGRVLHRGTPPIDTKPYHDSPKYGIFWSAASNTNDSHINGFLSFLAERSKYLRSINLKNQDWMIRRYDDINTIRFPKSFNKDTIQLINTAGINIKTVKI